MVEQVKGFGEHFAGFLRHLKLAIAVFVVILGLGAGFAFSLPDIYKSSAFILIEEPDIPESIVRSTVTTYTTKQLTTLNEKLLTVANLIRIIEKFDLYREERENRPVELLAFDMRQNIAIEIESRDSVNANGLPGVQVVGFSVGFEDQSPETAKQVVDELVSLYLEGNIKVRSEQTAETSEFLKGEVSRLEREIEVLENDLAKFKEENADTLPSMNSMNMSMAQRIDQDLLNIERQLNAIEENRIAIKAQLVTVEPSVPVRLADGSYAMSPLDQLKALQTQLSIYESKYSDDHPDVIAARRDIASIKERFGVDASLTQIDDNIVAARSDLAVAEEKYSPDHPDVVQLKRKIARLEQERIEAEQKQLEAQVQPDNPAYIQLETTLKTLDAEERALLNEQKELLARLDEYERRMMQSPMIEKELAALSRELSSTSNRYWVLRDKQFAAEMGETLENQSKGEEMVLIEPARVPLKPIKPNRAAIITLAFLFALVAGVGVTQLADALDKSIRDSMGIISVQGVPPLVEIPYIYNEAELAQSVRMRKLMIMSLPVAAVFLIVIVHFVIQPLDVLFYAIAARLGF